jgi:hypothetical protein
MKKVAKKKMTIDDLALMMTKGFKKTATKHEVVASIDNLAIIMAGSFSGLEERLTKKIDGVEEKLTKKIDGVEEKLTKKIDGVSDRLEGTNKRIDDFAETKVTKITYNFELRNSLNPLNIS